MAAARKTRSTSRSSTTVHAKAKVGGPDGPDLLRYWKPIAAIVIVVLLAWWVARMENVALRQRLDREYSEDQATGPWLRDQKSLVNSGDGPQAVWVGTVERLVTRQSRVPGGAGTLLAVELSGAELLAGKKGNKDAGGRVYIITDGHGFQHGLPAEGRRWLFSVNRNESDSNRVAAAMPAAP